MQPMFPDGFSYEDSRTITDYFKPNKQQIIKEKRQRKQEQRKNIRKNSTQLSIFGWLTKPRPKQHSKLISLPKNMMLSIYSYLRISEIMIVSETCFYLNQCAKNIWSDTQFLGQLQTDKLSYGQLQHIIDKGGRLSHIKQLRNIYRGKNIKLCRQKIKLRVGKFTNHTMNPVAGNLLQIFQVSPKTNKSSTFIMDSHISQIINSSFRSLTQIKLISCSCIKKFDYFSKCIQLTSLSITNNYFLSCQDLKVICKCCLKLTYLDISGCQYLDQNLFKCISKLENLQKLVLTNYQQPFTNVNLLSGLVKLKQVNIENCCIMDNQAIQLVNNIVNLQIMDIRGCKLLTDSFLMKIITQQKNIRIIMQRNQFNSKVVEEYEKMMEKFVQNK